MRYKPTHLFLLLLLFLELSGCAGLDHDRVIRDISGSGPDRRGYFIKDVPFFPQDESMCGPAALASVIGFWGAETDMKDVAKEVYVAKLKGTLPMDLLIFAKEKGFEARFYNGGLADLKEKVSGGTPLILFLNLGYDFYPVGHYIVAVGYDDRLGVVIAHSGLDREEVFTYDELVRSWGRTGYSTLLVKPKGGL